MSIKPATSLAVAAYLSLTSFSQSTTAAETRYVSATIDGERLLVRDDMQPALFTADYGDCLGSSSFTNVTRFGAANYENNTTVALHLGGYLELTREDFMISLGVYAYSESRFELTLPRAMLTSGAMGNLTLH